MALLPQGFQLPQVRKPLTAEDRVFVLSLPTAGTIAGAERTRLTMTRDAAQGVDARIYALAVSRLAQ